LDVPDIIISEASHLPLANFGGFIIKTFCKFLTKVCIKQQISNELKIYCIHFSQYFCVVLYIFFAPLISLYHIYFLAFHNLSGPSLMINIDRKKKINIVFEVLSFFVM